MRSTLMLLVVFVMGFAGMAGGQEAEDVADTADEKAEKPALLVVPHSLSLSRHIRFDEHGLFTQSSESCRLQVRAKIMGGYEYAGYKNINVKEAITDTGVNLAGHDQTHRSYIGSSGRTSFSFHLSLQDPPMDAEWLKKISGTVDLVYTDGATKEATIAPIKKMENKKLEITGVDQPISLKITRDQRTNYVYVHLDRDEQARLIDVKFVANGRTIDTRRSGYSSSGDTYKWRYHNVDLPDDGKVIVTVLQSVEKATVPFRVEAIPLIDPNRGEEGPQQEVVEIEAMDPGAAEDKEEDDANVNIVDDDEPGELP